MKTTHILFFCLLLGKAIAQEAPVKVITTKVNEVTVFLASAQVTSKKTIELEKGITLLKFINLSPYIDAKSIQVKAKGEIMVLSVNHQHNYKDKIEKPELLNELESKLRLIGEKEILENTHLSILREELSFIQENRVLRGSEQTLDAENLKEASLFYSAKLTEIKLEEIARQKTIQELNKEKYSIQLQMNSLTNSDELPQGEILVKVEAKKMASFNFEISYQVGNAGWFPSYDIRAQNINEPVKIVYKANVRQDTKMDWDNVKIRFSSADPNVSGIAPQLRTYYLNYNSLPPVYSNTSYLVRGRVIDTDLTPIPGATVRVQGSSIGAITDIDGFYSISIPQGANNLEYSYVGYSNEIRAINAALINVTLSPDLRKLEEVVVVGYGMQKKSNITGAIAAMTPGIQINEKEKSTNSNYSIPVASHNNLTSIDFEVDIPYTVKSDNKSYAVEVANYELSAYYQYFSVPKIDKSAFLIANITDWEKYNFLEGEANILFEDTYIGKTILDVRNVADTLKLSLGKDRSISVNREKVKDYTSKQFIGGKKIESRTWTTSIRNTKNQPINMMILDQIPVSTSEEIEVDVEKLSGAELDPLLGEVKWQFTIEPGIKREMELKYSVSFPKSSSLSIE